MAGVDIGTAVLQIQPSTRGLFKDLDKDLKGKGRESGKTYTDEFDKETSKAKGIADVANKALVFAGAVGAGFFGLASAAGNLEAAVAANVQVLGDASDAVQDFAENGVEQVGLSETAILNAATSFGQLGKIIGLSGKDLSTFSTDFVTLASDMAAFKNVSPEQALMDLQSAFAGQTEVVRKYGIFLDEASLKQALYEETGERVTGTLTAQQRVLATSIALFEKTGDIQGQAAREADSFERAIADIKATVGNIAADFGAPIVGFASDLIGAVEGGLGFLADWNEETGGMLFTGLAAGLGIAAAASAAVGIAGKVKGAVSAFKKLSTGMQLATGIVGGLALAVTAGFVIYGAMTQKSRELQARTKEVAGALNDATIEALEYGSTVEEAGGDVDGFTLAQRALSTALTTSGEDGEKLTQALGALGIQVEDAFGTLLGISRDPVEALASVAEQAGVAADQATLLGQAVNDTDGGADDLAISLRYFAEQAGFSHEEAKALADELLPTAEAMEEVQDQAEKTDLERLAEEFLNTASATSVEAEALVDEAQRRAEANEVADSSVDTYTQLMGLLDEMEGAQREAALEALGLAAAQTEAADAGKEQNDVAVDTIDTISDAEDAFNDAAEKADAFSDALDRLTGHQLDAQEASDQHMRGLIELDDFIRRAQKGEEGYSLTLDQTTEAGLDNREMIRGRVADITGELDAMRREGAAASTVTSHYLDQREALINQVMAFGLSRGAAEEYIATLGLTPDLIITTLTIANEQQARAAVEAHLAKVGEIPASVATIIEAAINEGDYARVEAQLNQLTRNRFQTIFVSTSTGGGRNRSSVQLDAFGAYIPGGDPQLHVMGEAPWDEAVLTVGNPTNLRRQLEDPKILHPILTALPIEATRDGRRRRPGGDFQFISYEQNPSPASVAVAMRMAGVE